MLKIRKKCTPRANCRISIAVNKRRHHFLASNASKSEHFLKLPISIPSYKTSTFMYNRMPVSVRKKPSIERQVPTRRKI